MFNFNRMTSPYENECLRIVVTPITSNDTLVPIANTQQ